MSCAFTLGPGPSSTSLANGGDRNRSTTSSSSAFHISIVKVLAHPRRELRSPGYLRNGHLRRFHRFRSVPSAKVVSHIRCDLSRGFQTSFCKLPASLSFQNTTARSTSKSLISRFSFVARSCTGERQYRIIFSTCQGVLVAFFHVGENSSIPSSLHTTAALPAHGKSQKAS